MSPQAKKAPTSGKIRVHVPPDLKPTYTNFALITNSPSEIVVDFAQVMPQMQQANVLARVVMTPLNTKLLLRALGEHLTRYEGQFGEIKLPRAGSSLADHLFRPHHPTIPPDEGSS